MFYVSVFGADVCYEFGCIDINYAAPYGQIRNKKYANDCVESELFQNSIDDRFTHDVSRSIWWL